jgi:hypothetical protein
MTINTILSLLIPAGIALILLLLTGFVIARLYKRATREISLVRTGAGGRKVVIDGGCMVIPMIHDLTRVSMRTLQISVQRNGVGAMITKDRLRVDSTTEFFVRVASNEDDISAAAQTLGDRTFDTNKLREMIEGKLVDGLRAVAVIAVVLFHAALKCPGGYIGVDVFFVISGYLITALILKDLERGSFSMVNFWERRIRRIFPALAVMVAATMLAGWFLLLPEDLAKLGASVIAQSLLVSNFYFWRTTNYFGGANEEKPLLHTWSLAVEEQFYLIFPIAIMAFWWAWKRWQKAQADRILGTTNHTNLHERGEEVSTTDVADGHNQAPGQVCGRLPEGSPKGEMSGSERVK